MTLNKFMVGLQGDKIRVLKFMATASMTKEDALNLAAWLVTMSFMAHSYSGFNYLSGMWNKAD